jgi:hypothetical protein
LATGDPTAEPAVPLGEASVCRREEVIIIIHVRVRK